MSWTKIYPWGQRRGKRLLSNSPGLTEPPLTDWNILNGERINDEDSEESGEIVPLSIVSELRQCSHRGRALRVSNPDHSLDMHSRARSYLCPFPRCNTGFLTEIIMRYHFLAHQVGPLEAFQPIAILQPESEQESRTSDSISSLASYHSEPAPIKHQAPFGNLTINQPQKPHSLVDTTESRHGSGSASICLMAPASVNARSGDPLESVLFSTHSTLAWSRLPSAHSSPGPELSDSQPGSTLVCKRASALTRSPELSTGSELSVSESCEFSLGLDSLPIKQFLSPLDAQIERKTSRSAVNVSTPPLVVDPKGFSVSPTLSLRKSLYGSEIGRIAHHSPPGQVAPVQLPLKVITSHSSSAVDEKKPLAPSISFGTYKHRAERVGCLYVPVWRYGYHTNPWTANSGKPCTGIDDGPPFNITSQSLVCEGLEKSENLGYIKLCSGFSSPTNALIIRFPHNYPITISSRKTPKPFALGDECDGLMRLEGARITECKVVPLSSPCKETAEWAEPQPPLTKTSRLWENKSHTKRFQGRSPGMAGQVERQLASRQYFKRWLDPMAIHWDVSLARSPPYQCHPELSRLDGWGGNLKSLHIREFYEVSSFVPKSIKSCSAGFSWEPGGFGDPFDWPSYSPESNEFPNDSNSMSEGGFWSPDSELQQGVQMSDGSLRAALDIEPAPDICVFHPRYRGGGNNLVVQQLTRGPPRPVPLLVYSQSGPPDPDWNTIKSALNIIAREGGEGDSTVQPSDTAPQAHVHSDERSPEWHAGFVAGCVFTSRGEGGFSGLPQGPEWNAGFFAGCMFASRIPGTPSTPRPSSASTPVASLTPAPIAPVVPVAPIAPIIAPPQSLRMTSEPDNLIALQAPVDQTEECPLQDPVARSTTPAVTQSNILTSTQSVATSTSQEPITAANSDMTTSSNTGPMRRERGRKKHKCDICEKEFSGKYRLDNHVKRDHLGQAEGYKCKHPGCNKSYANQAGLQRHFKANHVGAQGE